MATSKMNNPVTASDLARTSPPHGQGEALDLAESASERVAQAFRLLSALRRAERPADDPGQPERMTLLRSRTELLGQKLAALQHQLAEAQQRSRHLEEILRQILSPRLAA